MKAKRRQAMLEKARNTSGAQVMPVTPQAASLRSSQNAQTHSRYSEPRQQPPNVIEDVDTANNFFSPGQPVWPFGPPRIQTAREWDYPSTYNLQYYPQRFQFFDMLRTLARGWGVLHSLIETRKDEFIRLPWDIQYLDGRKPDARLLKVRNFFRQPSPGIRFNKWTRLILEDLLVIDAASVFLERDRGGNLLSATPVDGATIKPLIDDVGRRPRFPNPAYQQVIKGLPMVNLTERDLLYAPMRPKTNLPVYGTGVVEQIYFEVLQGIRRMLHQTNYWTEGTVPDMAITVPESWTPQQIAMFQAHFDAIMEGSQVARSKVRFLPGNMKPFEMKGIENLKTEYDELLIRVACFAVGVSPQAFVREMNRATAQTAQDQAASQGLYPIMSWFKTEIMDPLVQEDIGFGFDDMEFAWVPEDSTNPAELASIQDRQLRNGSKTLNEVRLKNGDTPYPPEIGDRPILITGTGAVSLEDALHQGSLPAGRPGTVPVTEEKPPSGKLAKKVPAPRSWKGY